VLARLPRASRLTFRQSTGTSRFKRKPIPSGSRHVSGKGTSSVIGQQIAPQSVDLNKKERNGL
jgi:hypothetical protein